VTPVLFAVMAGGGRGRRRTIVAVAVVALAVTGAALTVGAATATREPVRRTVWGQTATPNAPGQQLNLQQVVVDPGAALPEHFHEGTQLAAIRAGVLTYEVVSGSVQVTRADGSTETVAGPGTVKLRRGDSIIEDESLVHYGRNAGRKPVVIEIAALLRQGAPLATPVGDVADTTPMRVETVLTSEARTLHQAGPDASVTYGWNRLVGTATVDGQPVEVELLASVDYTAGNGPFFSFVTLTFGDGSTLAFAMQGVTTAEPDTADASFTATMGVIAGTGTYVDAAGSGTFTGDRPAALGGQVNAVFDLDLGKREG
jgi:quercetin dioxygenase-like cupin family protein